MTKLAIDNEKKMTVARATKRKSSVKLIYSDHFSVLLSLRNLPKAKDEVVRKETKWNLAKEDGWS